MPDPTTCASGKCTNKPASPGHGYCGKHAVALGIRKPMTSSQPTRDKIAALQAQGWSRTQIATAAGLAVNALRYIDTHPTVRTATAEKIAALHGTPPLTAQKTITWPYTRRLQSLQAAGHTGQRISDETSLPPATISWITHGRGDRINVEHAEAIMRYWDRHCTDPVTTPSRAAAGKLWVPPLWWDDIDDPDEQPGVSHCLDCHTDNLLPDNSLCKRCKRRRRYLADKEANRAA